MNSINPLDYRICFAQPLRLDDISAWIEHVPFGMFMIDLLRPNMLVELGTATGVSYSAFCQAIKQLGLETRCYAVDTWEGDVHGGYYGTSVLADLRAYHDPLYGEFSRLVQDTFDNAIKYFPDGSIDLLHIDGLHTYEAVKHDFETWRPKLSERGVVLFHDTNVRERNFGVWKLWIELKQQFPCFEFVHGHGLGVLRVGDASTPALEPLFSLTDDESKKVKAFFFTLGSRLSAGVTHDSNVTERDGQIASLQQAVAERDQHVEGLNHELAGRDGQIATLNQALAGRDGQLARLNQALAERDGQIASLNQVVAERDGHVASLRQAVAERDMGMATLNEGVAKRDRLIARLNKAVAERDRLHRKLQAIRISTSWRLTAPLRLIKRSSLHARRRLRKAAAIIARSLYRLLPLSARQKVLLKSWVFSSYPSFFRHTAAYRALAVGANTSVKQSSVGEEAGPSGMTQPVSQAFDPTTRTLVGAAVPSWVTRRVSQGPVISVVIPVYDRTDDLRACIHSILTQTFEDFEIILVTDGSPRETLHVLNEFANHPKVRVFMYPDNTGTAVRGRNRGIREARGRYVAFQDSDDVAEPRRLEWSVQALQESGAAVVYGGWRARLDGTRVFKGLEDGQVVYSPDCDLDSLLQTCVPCQSTVMAARAALLDVGGVKPSMRYREDHELWCRLAFFGYWFKAVNKVLINLKLHQGNNELNFQKDGDKWYEMLLQQYREKNFLPLNIAFAIRGADISGGVYVVFEHAVRLKNRGHQVTILSRDPIARQKLLWHPQALDLSWMTYAETQGTKFDVCFATWWETAYDLESIPAHHHAYFNQSVESRFYPESATENHRMAEGTYKLPYSIVTEATWIRDYIREKYRKEAYLVRNGIRKELYTPDGPCFAPREPGKFRVLVEGPLQVPFKNVARTIELCQGVADEVWLLTSTDTKEVKSVDRLFSRIPITVVPHVYRSCDVLVKLSYVEGMFGPPLEMFHCGGTAIVYDVSGHEEYIRDRHNALVAPRDDEETVKFYLQQLKTDADLLSRLKEGAAETARQWPDWEVASKEFEQAIRDIIHEQAKKWISNSTRSHNTDVVVQPAQDAVPEGNRIVRDIGQSEQHASMTVALEGPER